MSCGRNYVETQKIDSSSGNFEGPYFKIGTGRDGKGVGGWLYSSPNSWFSTQNKITDNEPAHQHGYNSATCFSTSDDIIGECKFAFKSAGYWDDNKDSEEYITYDTYPARSGVPIKCTGDESLVRCYKNKWNPKLKESCCNNTYDAGSPAWDCDPSWCPSNAACQSVWQTDKYSEYLVNLNNTDFCNTNSDKNCKTIMDAASTFDKTFPDKSKEYQIAYINKNCTGDKLVSEPCKSKCFKQGYDCDSAYTSKCADIYNAVSPGKNVGQIAEYINDNFPYCNCYLPSSFYRDYKNKILEDLPPSVKVLAKNVGDSPQECSYVYCATSSNYIPPSKSSYKCPDTQLCIANAKVNLDGGVVKAGHDISIANQNLNCKQGSYFSKKGSSTHSNGNGGNGDPDKDPGSPTDSKKLTKTQIIVISVVGGISFLLLVILMFFMLR